ncbi:MAG TPA: O-antigen ligase family protein, partial [Candidatus Baltobacteraceae bacterium]|nr:O-antigen ligase family protein [Candidatus Baltobacteraceae bacterium]
ALTLYLGFTVFWAIDQQTALNALIAYAFQAGLFVAIAVYPFSKKDLALLVGATLIGALAQSGYGGYLFLHGSQIWESRLYIGSEAVHSIDPNAFATALIAPIMLTLIFFLRAPSVLWKLLSFAALGVMLFAFMASGSRGAAIGLAVAIAFLVWRPHFRLGMFVSIAAAVIAAAASPLGRRFVEADVMTANGRMDIWKVGFASLSQYWLGGAGIGNFNNAFVQYYFATPHMWLPWDRVAHSIFLQSAVEGGIAGFALFIVFWYLQFRELARVPAHHPYADMCIALRAGVLGLLVAGFGLNLMEYKYTWLLFSLIAVTRTVMGDVKPSGKPRGGFE